MKVKHFIDTSVMRPLISSSSKVTEYYNSAFESNPYYCSYVKMEFIRGFIIPSMNFYSTLKMPNITSISDALDLWSNNFKKRELKAIISLISRLLSNHQLDFELLKEKENAAKLVADYIRRILGQLPYKFIDIGTDSKLCKKSSLTFKFEPDRIEDIFLEFINHYSLNSHDGCTMHLFLEKNQSKIDEIKQNRNTSISGSNKTGFQNIVDSLEKLENNNCKQCSKIGDLVIALVCPDNMRLEHTDNSFDYLMTILSKEHFKHPSEIKLLQDS